MFGPLSTLRTYAEIGAAIIIAALCGYVTFQKYEVAKRETEIATERAAVANAVAANAEQRTVIDRLTELRASEDAILSDLTDKLKTLNDATAETNDKLATLAKADANAKTYLNAPIPDSVRRLLRSPGGH